MTGKFKLSFYQIAKGFYDNMFTSVHPHFKLEITGNECIEQKASSSVRAAASACINEEKNF